VRHYRHDDRCGQSKCDTEFCSGRTDLFGRQFFAAHNFEQRHYRDLVAGGKQHSYNHLYLHPNSGQCASTATMTVTVNPNVTPSFVQVAPICSGGSFTLPTTSNNGIAGSWAPAVNNTTTTTYTFTPNSGQCATTATMTVTVNPNVTPSFAQVAPICSGGSFSLPTTSTMALLGTGRRR
jgi:hypothetical protein